MSGYEKGRLLVLTMLIIWVLSVLYSILVIGVR